MIDLVILVFVGGAFGAMCREFVMLLSPHFGNGFPFDIFLVNIIASFLLGLATSFHQSQRLHRHVHSMVGTGIMGSLSTFSSFVYGGAKLMQSPDHFLVGIGYLVISLVVGYIAVELGLWIAKKEEKEEMTV